MKKRILLLNDRLAGGGAEQVLQRVAADLAAQGAALTVWAPEGTEEELRRLYPAGTRFRRYPFWEGESRRFSPRWFFQRGCRVLFERVLLRLRHWDRVVAMKEGPCMRLASRLRAEKKLAWVHTDYRSFRWTHWHFGSDEAERACMAAFDTVVCVSETVRRGLLDTVGDPGNLRVLYNPIDAAAVEAKARPVPDDAQRPADGAGHDGASQRADEGVDSALAAVGNGHDLHLGPGAGAQHAGGDRLRGFQPAEIALE